MRLVPLDELSLAHRDRARDIYEANFPDTLRADFPTLAADVVLGYLDDDRTVCGLVVLRELSSRGWLFVRYFVAGERGRGIGSAMWRDLTATFPDVALVALDVEDPDEPGIDEPEETERRRRIVFYERLGLVLLPVLGYRPPHDGEEPPLRLMAWRRGHPDGRDGTDDLDDAAVRDVVLTVYRERYGLSDDDPAVVRTLRESGLATG